jgi:hypothetical protein
MFMVVRMSEWRISFCCTATGAPTESSHDRYVWRRVCVPRGPIPAFTASSLKHRQNHGYEIGSRPSFVGLANIQSSSPQN